MNPLSTHLAKRDATSDKVYQLSVVPADGGYNVAYANGPRNGTMRDGFRKTGITLAEAETLYAKILAEKIADGYLPTGASAVELVKPADKRDSGILPQLLNPVSDREAAMIMANPAGWGMQPKKDGHCKLMERRGDKLSLINRKGQYVGTPKEFAIAAAAMTGDFILHGEHVGSIFWAFDCLSFNGASVTELPYSTRYQMTEAICMAIGGPFQLVPLAETVEEMKAMHERETLARGEGVVFKKLGASYKVGRPSSGGDQLKWKFWASATCRVMALGRTTRSVTVGCLRAGELVTVGDVTVYPNQDMADFQPGALVEVKYLYYFATGSIYQPVLLGVRDDKDQPDEVASLKLKGEGD